MKHLGIWRDMYFIHNYVVKFFAYKILLLVSLLQQVKVK